MIILLHQPSMIIIFTIEVKVRERPVLEKISMLLEENYLFYKTYEKDEKK